MPLPVSSPEAIVQNLVMTIPYTVKELIGSGVIFFFALGLLTAFITAVRIKAAKYFNGGDGIVVTGFKKILLALKERVKKLEDSQGMIRIRLDTGEKEFNDTRQEIRAIKKDVTATKMLVAKIDGRINERSTDRDKHMKTFTECLTELKTIIEKNKE